MKPPSARLFASMVTLRKAGWTNVLGIRTPTYTDTPNVTADVQQDNGERAPDHMRDAGTITHKVMFPADPGVKVSDLILSTEGTLAVLAPASNQVTRDVYWVTYCRQET